MLSPIRGIVPQLVNQYNDLIEQNLCQTINLNEFRDNQNNRFDETIVLTDNNKPNKYPDVNHVNGQQLFSSLIREEGHRFLHQTNHIVLGLIFLSYFCHFFD